MQNALVRDLKGLVDSHHVCRFFLRQRISGFFRGHLFFLAFFVQGLVFVPGEGGEMKKKATNATNVRSKNPLVIGERTTDLRRIFKGSASINVWG
jgi:hypothetical protein